LGTVACAGQIWSDSEVRLPEREANMPRKLSNALIPLAVKNAKPGGHFLMATRLPESGFDPLRSLAIGYLSLRAKRGNPAAPTGLPRRCAPRNDGMRRASAFHPFRPLA